MLEVTQEPLINQHLSNTSYNTFTHCFIEWLEKLFKNKKIQINKNGAYSHIVDCSLLLVSPNIFRYFLTEGKKEVTEKAKILLKQSGIEPEQDKNKLVSSMQYLFFEAGIHLRDMDQKNILNFIVESKK